MDNYLNTNHWVDAVASLETAQEFCSRVTLDEAYWKWALIAVHSGVQGFMVLALEHGNALLAMKNDIAARWLKAHNAGAPYPEEKMDFFLNLYEKVKSDAVCRYVESKKFVPGPSHDYSMKKLNELQNNFIHFLPKVWSVELVGLPAVCLECLEIAHFLGWESGTILWHDSDLYQRGQRALAMLRASLREIKEVYTSDEN